MIKKLQALKAKKGFTLVELVVVIAIIGVLAAILIPTLIGVVQDANITSADSAANTLRALAATFVTNASNMHKATLIQTSGTIAVLKFSVDGAGKWTYTKATGDPAFPEGSKCTWMVPEDKTGDKDYDFCTYMSSEARDVKGASVELAVQDGGVVGLAVQMGTTSGIQGTKSDNKYSGTTSDDWSSGYAAMFPNKSGVTADNQIVGTNPKLLAAKDKKS